MLKFLTFLSLAIVAYSRNICYDQLGCFTDNYPFSGSLQRPFALLPESPQKIGVKFYLYNRKLGDSNEILNPTIIGDNFDSTLPTKFITHGFLHHSKKPWVLSMKNEILKAENVNVIAVDWSKGNGFPYTQATANTQVVGAEIARLIGALVRDRGVKPGSFHLIGHSLGAHISGYAGERIPGLGRITGLDPAGPYFENTEPAVRLDPTDALFVEAIHSDGTANLKLGLGLMQPLGHVDYYPNGGKDQPNCPPTSEKFLNGIFNIAILDIQGVEDGVACSHSAAFNYYTDSINSNCKYLAYPCSSKADFDSGKCLKCPPEGCNRMGYWSSQSKSQGTMYLNTQSPLKESFCKHSYLINLVSNSKITPSFNQARGKFSVYFENANQKSSTEMLDDMSTTFKPDSVENRIISFDDAFNGVPDSIYISYQKTTTLLSSWMYDNEWSFKYVEVTNGDTQVTTKFCPTSVLIPTGQTVRFKRC